VIDALADGLHAVAVRSPLAYPLVFAAGAVTSVGPCAAPRYVAVAALVSSSRTPWRIVAAFVAGLVGAYVVIGLAVGTAGALWLASGFVYDGLAFVLGAAGVVTILRGDRVHSHESSVRSRASLGGTFLLGASSALVVSPCCTPVVAGIAGLTTMSGRGADGAALLAAFGCGHALPVVVAGTLGSRVAFALRRVAASHAPATVAGSLMIALAAFYGALA
jgi:cytochrome c biogenesis protein CcdA